MPVALEIARTRSAGICPSSQRITVDLFTPNCAPNCSSVRFAFSRYSRSAVVALIATRLRKLQLLSTTTLRVELTTPAQAVASVALMGRPARIHKSKQPQRFHYIPEWAKHRHLKQADIARGLDVDKSTVSRWFEGAIPVEKHLTALTGFLEAEEPAALFRHPQDDWLARFFRGRSEAQRQRVINILKASLEEAA